MSSRNDFNTFTTETPRKGMTVKNIREPFQGGPLIISSQVILQKIDLSKVLHPISKI